MHADQQEKELIAKHNRVLSIISHDLKSPMVAINGSLALLRKRLRTEAYPDPSCLRLIEVMMDAGKGVMGLIEDILKMAKLEAGREEVEPEWVPDLAKELLRIHETFAYEARSRGVKLSVEMPSSLPRVRWDMHRLRYHAINNLISNALKFTPLAGRVTLSAEALETGVRLRITDTGPGIAPEDQDRIFRRFETGIKSERALESAGMGLYNASLFVRQHGGALGLDTSVSSGAAFVMDLPLDALTGREEGERAAA